MSVTAAPETNTQPAPPEIAVNFVGSGVEDSFYPIDPTLLDNAMSGLPQTDKINAGDSAFTALPPELIDLHRNVPSELEKEIGGGAVNASLTLQHIYEGDTNRPESFMTSVSVRVGSDPEGERIIGQLSEEGIDVNGILKVEGAKTDRSLVFIPAATLDDQSKKRLIVTERGKFPADLSPVVALGKFSLAHITSTGDLHYSEAAARQADYVSLDSGERDLKNPQYGDFVTSLDNLGQIKVNLKELDLLGRGLGTHSGEMKENETYKVLSKVAELLPTAVVIVGNDDKNILVGSHNSGLWETEVPKPNPFPDNNGNTDGAGDGLAAGFLYELGVKRKSLDFATQVGLATALRVVSLRSPHLKDRFDPYSTAMPLVSRVRF